MLTLPEQRENLDVHITVLHRERFLITEAHLISHTKGVSLETTAVLCTISQLILKEGIYMLESN